MRVHLRSQSELNSQLRVMLRDVGKSRWTDVEVYTAFNLALDTWVNRVSAPMRYVLPDGFTAGVYEYALPGFIRPPIQPQFMVDDGEWVDVMDYVVEPDDADGLVLRVRTATPTADGRIIWAARNGHVPTTIPTLLGEFNAASTYVYVSLPSTANYVGDAGYVKLVGGSTHQYAGLDLKIGAKLLNVVHGVNGTFAAGVGVAGGAVEWMISAPDAGLFGQLLDQAAAHCHLLFLGNASPNEQSHHERMISFHQARADAYWRRYAPSRSPHFVTYSPVSSAR